MWGGGGPPGEGGGGCCALTCCMLAMPIATVRASTLRGTDVHFIIQTSIIGMQAGIQLKVQLLQSNKGQACTESGQWLRRDRTTSLENTMERTGLAVVQYVPLLLKT